MTDEKGRVKAAPSLRDLIRQFANGHRGRLWRLTASSSRFADLLTAFPAAAVAIAVRRPGEPSREEAVRLVDGGAPLDAVARALCLPLWFRRLPPAALATAPVWPAAFGNDGLDESALGARLLNLMPRSPSAAAPWLETVVAARAAGGDELAIWIAGLKGVWKRSAERLPVRLLALYAWHSRHSGGEAARSILCPWQPSMGIARAVSESRHWVLEVLQRSCGCDVAAGPVRRRTWQLDGLGIVPLTTPAEIMSEARAMGNCLPQYIAPVMAGECRLYGLRDGERRVATLEVRLEEESGRPYRRQLCRCRNGEPPQRLVEATDAWIAREAAALRREFMADFGGESETLFRDLVWRPYALAGGLSTEQIAAPAIADILREMEGLGAYAK